METTAYAIKPEQKKLFEDYKAAAQLMNAPFNEQVVSQFLSVFDQFFVSSPEQTSVMLRIDDKNPNRVALRYTDVFAPHNPFELALEGGLIERTDHPIYDLYDQTVDMVKLLGHGADFSSELGFEKIWPYFHPISVDDIHTLPAMPKATCDLVDFYHKYDLHRVSILGYDYPAQTMNVYFFHLQPYAFEQVEEMFADMGLERPSDEEIEYCTKALGIYMTYRWDSPDIQRVCYCTFHDTTEDIPNESPLFNDFVQNVKLNTNGNNSYMFCHTYGKNIKPYLKLETDYAGNEGQLKGVLIGSLM